jgi:hypothetical protein
MPLHSTIDEVVLHIRANLNSVDNLTRGISREQFNWRPDPGRWSVGQCIGHLNLINGADLKPLRAAIDGGRSRDLTAAGPFQYGFMSKKFVAVSEPPPTSKFRAPKLYQPPAELEIEATLNEYRRVSNELLGLVESARGLDLAKVKAGLSGIPLVKMQLGARFSLLTTHDSRHLWQAQQVIKDARFPK